MLPGREEGSTQQVLGRPAFCDYMDNLHSSSGFYCSHLGLGTVSASGLCGGSCSGNFP